MVNLPQQVKVNMGTQFSDLTNLLSNIGEAETVTVIGDSSMRGGNFTQGSGITISRAGNITGSAASGKNITITLEGGNAQWDGALTQDQIGPYYTRAQLTLVSSLRQYVESMSNASFEDNTYQ